MNNAVKFESGKLILSDEKYNLAWLKTAKAALNNADSGTMGLVVTGTLVTTDGKFKQKQVPVIWLIPVRYMQV